MDMTDSTAPVLDEDLSDDEHIQRFFDLYYNHKIAHRGGEYTCAELAQMSTDGTLLQGAAVDISEAEHYTSVLRTSILEAETLEFDQQGDNFVLQSGNSTLAQGIEDYGPIM